MKQLRLELEPIPTFSMRLHEGFEAYWSPDRVWVDHELYPIPLYVLRWDKGILAGTEIHLPKPEIDRDRFDEIAGAIYVPYFKTYLDMTLSVTWNN